MNSSKIQFYNTLTRRKENFIPINKNKVLFYSCGPTVYNYPHIGNYRAYIFADTLKRVLMYEGYKVKHIMNLTDIDDKTIRESKKEGKTLKEFTEFYSEEFFKDIKAELKKVTYPTKSETIGSTTVVLILVFVVGIYLSGMDMMLVKAVRFIIQ